MNWHDLLRGFRNCTGFAYGLLLHRPRQHYFQRIHIAWVCGAALVVVRLHSQDHEFFYSPDSEIACCVQKTLTDAQGWVPLVDLLLDDPEAGPHVRALLEGRRMTD